MLFRHRVNVIQRCRIPKLLKERAYSLNAFVLIEGHRIYD